MLNIKEKSVYATFEYTDESYKITGDFKKSAEGELRESGMNVSKADDGTPVGYANAYSDGDGVKYNLSGVELDAMEAVSASVKACAEAIMADNTIGE